MIEVLGVEFQPHYLGQDGRCRDNSMTIPVNRDRGEGSRFKVYQTGKWRVRCPVCNKQVSVVAEQSSGGALIRVKARTLDSADEVFVAGLYRGIDFNGDWRLRADRRWVAAVQRILGEDASFPWQWQSVRLPLRAVGHAGKTQFVTHELPEISVGTLASSLGINERNVFHFTRDGHLVKYQIDPTHEGEGVVTAYDKQAGIVFVKRKPFLIG